MRKKLTALLCAAMLACALPALAWAEEAAGPTVDQATAQETGAATRSIGPWQESASNEDGSFVLSGETRAASFAVIATSETADDALDGMPSFRVVAENATKKIDFGAALIAGGKYAGCNKLEVHVKPSAGSAGVAKTFEVTRAASQSSFNFTSEMFNLGDQTGDASYNADFIMTLVPSKVDTDEPAVDDPAALPSGTDTGATSPKTGMGAGAVAGASFGMLAAAGVVAFALRRKLA
ncbi:MULTISPECIES: hypothetical protein [Gordonibacter]|uniref:hypothetical protein n=1 Tax=Gordonibacter TaxID=644652 RepID=UPI00261E1F4D|nr:hypothetical protein [Gordonibacter sp. RACS_AR49]MDN4510500.1 hypothetical protein [Gordonibacter sp. RACS_AR49]